MCAVKIQPNYFVKTKHKEKLLKIKSSKSTSFDEFTRLSTLFIKKLKQKQVCPIFPKEKQNKIFKMADNLNDFLVLTTLKKANLYSLPDNRDLKNLHIKIQKVFRELKENHFLNQEDLNDWAELAPYLSQYTLLINN